MYAVIKAGGKQHRVKTGDVIEVELMHGGDDAVQFHPLLVVDDENKTHVGKELQKATVSAKLVGEQKGDKVKVFKYRNKTGFSRRQGHRQMYTLVEIGEIKLPGAQVKKAAAASAAKSEEPVEAPKAAPRKSTAKVAAAKTAAAAEPEAAATEDEAAEVTKAAPA
jgi:large subunit ribosomal protein L21